MSGCRLVLGALCVIGAVSYGCSTVAIPRADPLVNRIVRVSDQQEVSKEQLIETLAEAQVVYLGETHDNPHHHKIELEVIQQLLSLGKQPAVGFEAFSIEQTGFLMHYSLGEPSPFVEEPRMSVEEILRKNLGWGKDRDKDWQFYFPLLSLAREHKLAAFGADLPAGLRFRVSRVGLDGLSALETRLLQPTAFEDADYQMLMYQKLIRSHCGWSSPQLLARLYDTWLARNDAMAAAIVDMVNDQQGQPVVVILGAGHVQHNMGVYERVAYLLPGAKQVNLGLREIAIEPLTLDEYVANTQMGERSFAPEHEYFWFTPRVSYEDPCEKFKDRLKRVDAGN